MTQQEIINKAEYLTEKVSFLDDQEKELYMSSLIGAMQWAQKIDEENLKIRIRKSRANNPAFHKFNQN